MKLVNLKNILPKFSSQVESRNDLTNKILITVQGQFQMKYLQRIKNHDIWTRIRNRDM